MTKKKQTSPIIRPELPLGETERLLDRVDENLLSRRFLQPAVSLLENDDTSVPTIPLPPAGVDMEFPLSEMRGSEAPYYVVNGSGLARILKRLHNMVLKVFGRKQSYFNNLAINHLETLSHEMEALREYTKIQTLQINLLSHRIREQQKIIKELRIAQRPTKPKRKASGKRTT